MDGGELHGSTVANEALIISIYSIVIQGEKQTLQGSSIAHPRRDLV